MRAQFKSWLAQIYGAELTAEEGAEIIAAVRMRIRTPPDNPIKWNPYNKVVQDHRDGTIDHEATNQERAKRGLPVPWNPRMGDTEVREKPIA